MVECHCSLQSLWTHCSFMAFRTYHVEFRPGSDMTSAVRHFAKKVDIVSMALRSVQEPPLNHVDRGLCGGRRRADVGLYSVKGEKEVKMYVALRTCG